MSQQFCEKDMMLDLLASEKHVTGGYNNYANECATPAVKAEFLNLLKDTHQMQHDIFCEMQKRGWYPTEAADQNKINQAKQKYSTSQS